MDNVVSIFSKPKIRCATCSLPTTQVCGALVMSSGHACTCDRPVCPRCASLVFEDVVYCPQHARAAKLATKTPPAPVMPVLGKVVAR